MGKNTREKRSRRWAPILLAFGAVAAVLATCAMPTPYQPSLDGYGYSETKLQNNRYRVAFAGNSLTRRQTVEDYLLYRAAELTLTSGFQKFELETKDTEEKTWYRTSFNDFYGHGFYHHSFHHFHDPFYQPYRDYSVRPVRQYSAYADILMLSGKKSGSERAFDANEIVRNLGSKVVRPAPPA